MHRVQAAQVLPVAGAVVSLVAVTDYCAHGYAQDDARAPPKHCVACLIAAWLDGRASQTETDVDAGACHALTYASRQLRAGEPWRKP